MNRNTQLIFQISHSTMKCTECEGPPTYKCPTCRQPYCSVPCCKKHKDTQCLPTVDASVETIQPVQTHFSCEFPTEDTVSPDKLALLEKSEELKKCLENPHVRNILETLDKSPHPDRLIQEYMQEPIFTEFVDACLKVVQDSNSDDGQQLK